VALQGRKERKVFMKKLLLIVAMLLTASQVMADVTITAVNEGTFALADGNRAATIRVDYSGTTNVRAFALDFNVDSNCNFQNIRSFKTGENNGVNNGYGIFPGRFRSFIQVLNGTDVNSTGANGRYGWADANYNPTPPWNDPGTTGTGIGFGAMIVEMGYLGATDANKPPSSGTLFRVDVNGYKFVGTAHLTIAADTMRGGVVDKDTNATTTATVTYTGVNIVFPCAPVAIPSILNDTMTDANAALAAAGFSVGTISYTCSPTYAVGRVMAQDSGSQCTSVPVNYTVSTGLCCTNIPTITTMLMVDANTAIRNAGLTGTISITYAASSTIAAGRVISQDTGCVASNATIHYVASWGCYTGPNLVQWQSVGSPSCWCASVNPRQCHGDADGQKQGKNNYWVSTQDLDVLSTAYNKTYAQITGQTKLENGVAVPLICADFDQLPQGKQNYRVSTADLTILTNNFNKNNLPAANCP
jgi:uncharacterized lipoprotein YajG